MRSTSRINSSLSRRRRLGLLKKVVYIAIFVIFFLSLIILGLTNDKVQIKSVSVSGNISVPKEDILKVVERNLDKRYLFIIRTDNFFLLKRWEIREEILDEMKKIQSVDISFHSLNSVEISVAERVAKSIWCAGSPANAKKCYFMDENGFIFTEAPDFNSNSFPEYFGLISGNPIGQSYFNSSKFKEISHFFESLDKIGLSPISFNAIDEHQYEIYLSAGGKIIMDDKKTFEKDIENIQAVIDSGYIKTDPESLKKIKSIDLRFGNKVILN